MAHAKNMVTLTTGPVALVLPGLPELQRFPEQQCVNPLQWLWARQPLAYVATEEDPLLSSLDAEPQRSLPSAQVTSFCTEAQSSQLLVEIHA